MAKSLYKTSAQVRKFILAFLLFSLCIVVYDFYGSISKTTSEIGFSQQRRFYMLSKPFEWLDSLPPAPDIPSIDRDTNNSHTYAVEGVFDNFPDVAYVYTIEEPAEKLLTFQNAQNTVSKLGFDSNDFTEQDRNVAVWVKDNGVTTISFDRVTQKWEMKTDLTNNPRFIEVQKVSNDRRNNLALSLLNSISLSGRGFSGGYSEQIFLKRDVNGELKEVDDVAQAQLILANAYRILPFADLKPQSEQPELLPGEVKPRPVSSKVYTQDPFRGSASFLTKGSNPSRDVYEFKYINWEYTDEIGAYPIITPEEAWNNVQSGLGSLVFIRRQGDDTLAGKEVLNVRRYVVDANQTEVGFYEPSIWNVFVTPIYIFRGRAELEDGRQASFIFYIDALKRL